MTAREWIAVVGIVFSIIAAAVGYGQMSGQIDDARDEIRLLREDMRAINQHFIVWAARHQGDR